MSMRVERSSLDQVKKRFEMNKRKLEEKKKDYDFEERMKELKEEVSIIGLDKHFFERKIVNIFLPISFNICFGCSKELSH